MTRSQLSCGAVWVVGRGRSDLANCMTVEFVYIALGMGERVVLTSVNVLSS